MEKNYKVLVVDDTKTNLQVVGNILNNKGIDIIFAKNGFQAIKIALKKSPDLILLDINMPEMNGYQTCEILKKDDQTKEIPVIFLTALNEKEDVIKGFNCGGVDYITKPFDKSELLARVFTHLELKYTKDKLISQNEELRTLNATKDKLFSIISHDLKNPFNAIIGLSSILLTNHKKYTDEKREYLISSVNTAAENAFKLLENLLAWSRSQSGKIEYLPRKINILDLSAESLNSINEIAVKKEIHILNLIPKHEIVLADIDITSTIFRNLVSNAIKFTGRDGNIIISSKKQANNNFFEISIEDTGEGISPKSIKNLFNIDKNTSAKGTEGESGTGLGLILCKEFAEIQGGQIWAESELGVGSKFIFTLPIE